MTGKKRKQPARIAFFGAAPDTPNMGVSALFYSTIYLLSQRIPGVEFVIFDNGLGEREKTLEVPEVGSVRCTLFGARAGRRYYRPENLATMCFTASLGRLGKSLNRGLQLIDSCDVVIDISGGDSFSDIYGTKRFMSIIRPKILAHRLQKPLILLPQTYGPFQDPRSRKLACSVVRFCETAWARDEFSFENLSSLAAGSPSRKNLQSGVDMAFGLPAKDASTLLSAEAMQFIKKDTDGSILIGFNISGLIYNDSERASRKYGFKSDYKKLVVKFLTELLSARPEVRVCMIPHVLSAAGHYESDIAAGDDVYNCLENDFPNRLFSVHGDLDQGHLKWLISQMAWFCGTRMHSTIASLSSGVPTASIVYSDKAKGVFRSCDQERAVCDPRAAESDEIIPRLIALYDVRDASREELSASLVGVRQLLQEQVDSVSHCVIQHFWDSN